MYMPLHVREVSAFTVLGRAHGRVGFVRFSKHRPDLPESVVFRA